MRGRVWKSGLLRNPANSVYSHRMIPMYRWIRLTIHPQFLLSSALGILFSFRKRGTIPIQFSRFSFEFLKMKIYLYTPGLPVNRI